MALKKGTALISKDDRKLLVELGSRIRELREAKGKDVYDVTGEDMLIKSRQHWQKIEAGQLSLTFVTFMKIVASLECTPSDLLKGLKSPF